MDISKLKPVERTIEIKHPVTGLNLGVSVTIISPDDERLKAATRAVQDRNLLNRQKNKTITTVDVEENTTKLMVAAILSWNWYGKDIDFEGKKPEFTPENVKKILTTPGLEWFRRQIDEELSETKSFFIN